MSYIETQGVSFIGHKGKSSQGNKANKTDAMKYRILPTDALLFYLIRTLSPS